MGSGYKAFTAGAVLTASDLNNYCQEQSVMYFANTAARDAALPSGTREDGMTVYVGSNDSSEGIYTFNGSSWTRPWNTPWGVVGRALITSSTSATTAATVTGSTITYTQTANRVYKYSVTGHAYWVSVNDGFRCSITNGTGTSYIHHDQLPLGNSTNYGNGFSFNWYETPASSGSVTRELRVSRFYGTSGNVEFFADATRIGSLIIEDIGPSGAPS
jgi:hypothetical protein